MMDTVNISAIHLYTLCGRVRVAVEVNGAWIDVINELEDGPISHIAEVSGLQKAINQRLGSKKQ